MLADIYLDRGTVTLPLSALAGLPLLVAVPEIPAPGVAKTYSYEIPGFTSPYDMEPYLVLAHVMSDGRVLWSCTCKDWQFRGNVKDPCTSAATSTRPSGVTGSWAACDDNRSQCERVPQLKVRHALAGWPCLSASCR